MAEEVDRVRANQVGSKQLVAEGRGSQAAQVVPSVEAEVDEVAPTLGEEGVVHPDPARGRQAESEELVTAMSTGQIKFESFHDGWTEVRKDAIESKNSHRRRSESQRRAEVAEEVSEALSTRHHRFRSSQSCCARPLARPGLSPAPASASASAVAEGARAVRELPAGPDFATTRSSSKWEQAVSW